MLEETVPVDGGRLVHGVVVEVVDDVKLEVVSLKISCLINDTRAFCANARPPSEQ